MSTQPQVPGLPALQGLRILAAGIITMPLVLVLVIAFVLTAGTPPAWAVGAVAAVGLGGATLASIVGFRVKPLPVGQSSEDARAAGVDAFRTSTILRLALTEPCVFVGLALAFVVEEGGLVLFVIAAVLGVVLMVLLAWPGDRSIQKVEESLDREGGRSQLAVALRG